MKFVYHILTISLLISCQENGHNDGKAKSFDTAQTQFEKLKVDSFELIQSVQQENEGFIFSQNEYIYFDELNSEYGILIMDHEFDDVEDTYYELFYRTDKKIFKTSDVQKLKKQLSKLPSGTSLNWCDTCTFSKMRGLSENKKRAFIEICIELGLHLIEPSWEESRNIKCYCDKYP